MSQLRISDESSGGPSLNTEGMTYDQARQQLQSIRARLSHTIQDYLAACQMMQVICSAAPQNLGISSAGREQALLAIEGELLTFLQEETRVRQSRDILTDTLNRSKMTTPIYSFPPEILARIFSEAACYCTDALAKPFGLLSPVTNPVALSAVCRQWRKIAINHRSLWTHIDLEVGRLYTDRGYYPSEIWEDRSRGASLYVQIRQYRSFEDGDTDSDVDMLSALDNCQHPASMVTKLLEFLMPLMRQVFSLSLNLDWPHEYIAAQLIDCWTTNGISGQAKILKIDSSSDYGLVKISSPIHYLKYLESLQVLHLCNIDPPWTSWTFNNLIDLRFEFHYDDNNQSMHISKLGSMLTSCPKLKRLALGGFKVKISRDFTIRRIVLGELQCLEVGYETTGTLLSHVLETISPGENTLRLKLSLGDKDLQRALALVRLFLDRANVKILHLVNPGEPHFASELGALPRVQTLILDSWHFSSVVKIVDDILDTETYQNPLRFNPEVVLWSDLRELYLDFCVLEKEYLFKFVSHCSIETLHLRGCFRDQQILKEFQIDSQASDEYVQLLSEVVPKVLYSQSVSHID
ncbi:hypothetical protein FRC12_019204 [Ceratobasidium sp. 428]|nr:hypothetical protein FRC09_008075 [Ceratobasidium sp. 395]KAG8732617.1 hypothetical protein FRC12_019204 [Ceratobasidium sp. 428]